MRWWLNTLWNFVVRIKSRRGNANNRFGNEDEKKKEKKKKKKRNPLNLRVHFYLFLFKHPLHKPI